MTGGREQFDRPMQGAPDLTRKIMGRLGYMRVVDEVARARRRTKWLRRCAMCAAIGMALYAGFRVYETSDAVRRPAEVTVPSAFIHDVGEQQQRLQNMFDVFRERGRQWELAPHLPVEDAGGDQDIEWNIDGVNESIDSPLRWV